ncbi:trimeric intracellular cation channel family protein, partial [Neisseria sp. P0018.S002]|uniref:trimeric intracellular cation channel family protein n=1 Tax=Neisseria sp. P0018.S002 TaxID=3436788 RepID=UPI003F7EF635
QIGMTLQLNLCGVISLAFVTAVVGGIARDILVNDVPMILRTDLYGSVAILIGGLIYLFVHLGWINIFTLNLLFAGGLLFRLTAYRFHWQLPGFQRHRK